MITSTKLQFFLVGGFVRDGILGVKSKDVDFSVVGADSFDDMVEQLTLLGFIILTTKVETLTAVCRVPSSFPELKATSPIADFVMARKESSDSKGRMPDEVSPGSLLDDLSRRDFTVNALAVDSVTGEMHDPFGGVADLEALILRFVGSPSQRVGEDALRVARGFRFIITKGLVAEPGTWAALISDEAVRLLNKVDGSGKRVISVERLQVELSKMFLFDTQRSLDLVCSLPRPMRDALFPEGLKLKVTM